MIKSLLCFVCASVIALPLSAKSQINDFWSVDTKDSSLDGMMSGLLVIPQVQAELKLSQRQTTIILTRIMMMPLRTLPKIAEAMSNDDESVNNNLTFNSKDVPYLKPSELTPSQRLRLKELFLQVNPLAALGTTEVQSELKFTDKQAQSQGALVARLAAEIKKKALFKQTFNLASYKKLSELMSKYNDEELDDSQRKEALAAYDQLILDVEKIFVQKLCEMNAVSQGIRKGYGQQALKLLTPVQRSQYRKLCGKIAKG